MLNFKRCFKIASLTDSSINIYGVAGDTDGIDGVSPHAAYISLPRLFKTLSVWGLIQKNV